MKPFLIAVAFVFAILILGWTSERPSTQIDIGDGFIASGHYAVVEEAKLGGSTLFLGSSAGIPMLAFHSDDQLYNPFIVDSTRVLLVEGHSGSGFNYRLLDIHLDGANVTCRRLVESMQYIGYPVVPSGSRKNEVWFFSGKYNAKATGIPVNKHRLTALIDRKVEFFNGPTFLTISRPTQIKEDQFIAASPMIQTGKPENDKFAENELLVDLLTDGMKLDAKAADFQQIPDASIMAVTSLAGSQQLLVLSYTVWGGTKYFITYIPLAGNSRQETSALPGERAYSGVYLDRSHDGAITFRIMSKIENLRGKGGQVTISDFVDGKLFNEKEVKLDTENRFESSSCLSDAVTF